MGENITKIKVGNDVHCISLDTQVIHPDTRNYLQPEPYGLSLKLDTMAEAMAEAVGKRLGLAIDGYNDLKIGTKPLRLGTGLKGGDNGKTLCLSLGSGLENDPIERKIRVKLDDEQHLIVTPPGGELTFNLNRLYDLLEARYNLTKK